MKALSDFLKRDLAPARSRRLAPRPLEAAPGSPAPAHRVSYAYPSLPRITLVRNLCLAYRSPDSSAQTRQGGATCDLRAGPASDAA